MSAIPALAFRRTLGHLPTGVTVITAHGPDGPIGMAANSVTSLSLQPPMILFCPANSSKTWPALRDVGTFCVNVMSGHHEAVTRQFAARGVDRFQGVSWTPRPAGPGLADAVAWIECKLHHEHAAGDHIIAIASVLAVEAVSDRSPLVFFQGRYGCFGERRGG